MAVRTPREWLDFVCRHGWEILFWIVLAAASGVLIYPIWIGPISPTIDFGGHLAMADIWARYDEVELYREAFERRGGLRPNSVSVRFVGWLHPLCSTLTAMRLFTTLTLVGTVLGIASVLRTFGRSRWLVFGALPLLWNGSFYWGMVNYFACFPSYFFAIALARKTGRTGDWRWGGTLTIVCTATFFIHGLGCPFVVASAAFVLLLSLQRWRDTLWFGAFLPPTALWIYWMTSTDASGIPDAGFAGMLWEHSSWLTKKEAIRQIAEHAADFTVTQVDTGVFLALVGILVLWWGVSRGTAEDVETDGGQSASDPAPLPVRAYRQLRAAPLLSLTCLLGAAYFIVPSYVHETNVATRLVPLLLWTAVCVPRIPERDVLAMTGIVLAVGISVGYGLFLADRIRAFERRELTPVMDVIGSLPDRKRVECLNTGHGPLSGLRGWPMRNNCPGLVYSYTSGFGGFTFPQTGFNPIEFTEAYGYPSLGDAPFSRLGRLQWWDYLIVRGDRHPPPERLVEEVATSSARGSTGGAAETSPSRYVLYRVRDPEIEASFRDITGGEGGRPFRWPCPDGETLRGIDGWVGGAEEVFGLRSRCGRPGRETESRPSSGGETDEKSADSTSGLEEIAFDSGGPHGPVIGSREAAKKFSARCPPGQFVVGLVGKSGTFVNRTDLLCAPVRRSDDGGRTEGALFWSSDEVSRAGGGGGSAGSQFRMVCPEDSVVRGLRGRDGVRLDAVGITCQPVSRLFDGS